MQVRHASGLVDLLQENIVLRADLTALIGILEARELTGQISGDWRVVLQTIRKTQAYQSILHRYDHLLERAAEASTRVDIDHMPESVELLEPLT